MTKRFTVAALAVAFFTLLTHCGDSTSRVDELNYPKPSPSKQDKHNEKIWPRGGLRGVNTRLVLRRGSETDPGVFLSDETFERLSEWKVNVIRVSIGVDSGSIWDVRRNEEVPPVPQNDLMAPYRNHFKGLKVALELADKHDILVIVTAGNVVERRAHRFRKKIDPASCREALVHIWTHMAEHFGGQKHLIAYDLMNEPKFGDDNDFWQDVILPELVRKIRKIDKDTYVIIEPGPGGTQNGFKWMEPVKDPKVVYSFHLYSPVEFTHQGLGRRPRGSKYPGEVRQEKRFTEEYWNRGRLKQHVETARDFQKRHHVRLFVGEFSAIRWAPGAAQWLEDAISIFEAYGWDWCYHSYGGWNGWNPTFSSDDKANNEQDGGKMTDRLKVLMAGWSKNQR